MLQYVGFIIYLAGVAKLADALGLGPSGSNPMEVQFLSPAPLICPSNGRTTKYSIFLCED